VYSEFFSIQEQALNALRKAVDAFDLQILYFITFGFPTAYYIYRKNSEIDSYSLRVSQWNKYFDLEITQNPIERLKYIGKNLKPTIIQKEISFPDQKPIEELLLKFRVLNIPETAKSDWGLDGATTEVAFFRHSLQTEVRYIWWGNVPKEWKSLEHLRQEAILLFRQQSQIKGWAYL
jgi:hypothetical protein